MRRDVHVVQPDLTILNFGIRIYHGCFACSKGFNLSSNQDDTCRKHIIDVIFVSRPSVLCHNVAATIFTNRLVI
jgi:hypothetical protein